MPTQMRSTSAEPTQPEASNATGQPALNYRIARTCEDVEAAWRLVYQAYRRIGLIDPNPFEIHTTPHAVNGDSVVVMGLHEDRTLGATLTAMLDAPNGLPLDHVYPDELATLRNEGRKLIEVGLFADRRRDFVRTTRSLLELMRFAFHYGWQQDVDDFVIGVHPHHAKFYCRMFSFEIHGGEKQYSTVNDHPVVLLRGDLPRGIQLRRRAVDYALRNPVEPDAFADRFSFDDPQLRDSRIAAFLQHGPRRPRQRCA